MLDLASLQSWSFMWGCVNVPPHWLWLFFTLHGRGWNTSRASSSSLCHILKTHTIFPSLHTRPQLPIHAVLLFLCLCFLGAEARLMQMQLSTGLIFKFIIFFRFDCTSCLCLIFILDQVSLWSIHFKGFWWILFPLIFVLIYCRWSIFLTIW